MNTSIERFFIFFDPDGTHILQKDQFPQFFRKLVEEFQEKCLDNSIEFIYSDYILIHLWSAIEQVSDDHRGITISKLQFCIQVFEWSL